jgi:hypothetical protein
MRNHLNRNSGVDFIVLTGDFNPGYVCTPHHSKGLGRIRNIFGQEENSPGLHPVKDPPLCGHVCRQRAVALNVIV